MAKVIITKRCSRCKKRKPLTQFSKNRTQKDGHQSCCKICALSLNRDYRQTEKGKATEKRYAQSQKGKANRQCAMRLYKDRHPERHKSSEKRYRQSEKKKEALKRYCARHPERAKAVQAVNNAIRAGILPRPDSLECHDCPKKAKQYHHHKGYEPEFWLDVVPVCIKCHNKIPKR